MSHPSKKSSPLWHNPVQALCFAATYGLCETQKAAIEAVQPGRFTFDRPDQIKLLAENFPNPANVIGLLGAHCTRAHSLRELVFQTSLNDPSTGHAYLTMSCQSCYKEWGFPSPNKIPNFRPTWWPAWSVMAFCCLATEPFDKARRVFQISTLRELTEDLSVCRPCIDATCGVGGKDTFLAWTAQLETRVRERLGEIEALYEL
ncbi:hypothetical protein FS749_000818 [Ceratobasidium sp. UAMH 11750]|nr:hypothetical protein FS749_000818 [Ceratobasidium sp. UAMH 11750]